MSDEWVRELHDAERARWEAGRPDSFTWTRVRLCSMFNEEASLTCDMVAGHDGPHRATLLWTNEDEVDA
jgi:hypothetical protein